MSRDGAVDDRVQRGVHPFLLARLLLCNVHVILVCPPLGPHRLLLVGAAHVSHHTEALLLDLLDETVDVDTHCMVHLAVHVLCAKVHVGVVNKDKEIGRNSPAGTAVLTRNGSAAIRL